MDSITLTRPDAQQRSLFAFLLFVLSLFDTPRRRTLLESAWKRSFSVPFAPNMTDAATMLATSLDDIPLLVAGSIRRTIEGGVNEELVWSGARRKESPYSIRMKGALMYYENTSTQCRPDILIPRLKKSSLVLPDVVQHMEASNQSMKSGDMKHPNSSTCRREEGPEFFTN